MSAQLWVAYVTPAQTFVDKVCVDGCSDVADFLKEIKKEFVLAVPPSHLTLFQPDGTTEIDVGGSLSDYMNGNSRENPLIVKTKYIEPATIELYTWKATKKPFKVMKIVLNEGRLPLQSLLQEEHALALYLIRANGDVSVFSDKDGFSTQKWENGQTYKFRVKTSTSVDIDITFSEKDRQKMDIFSVSNDFGIKFDDTKWQFSGDSLEAPVALTQTLALYAEYNTLRLEQSRRSIVSLFLHYAISTIEEGKNKLCIDEETPLAIVRNVDRNGEPKIVRYSGPVDFVIGHSKLASSMPNDAAVMVIETKKSDTFDSALSQVVAQAAALLFFRRGMSPPRGLNGSGGPIVFIRTDGERWIFSRMTCEEGFPLVQHSNEFKIDICGNNIDNDTLQRIFDWLRYAITVGRDSTPRALLSQINQNVPDDEETITAQFSDFQIHLG